MQSFRTSVDFGQSILSSCSICVLDKADLCLSKLCEGVRAFFSKLLPGVPAHSSAEGGSAFSDSREDVVNMDSTMEGSNSSMYWKSRSDDEVPANRRYSSKAAARLHLCSFR
mmetsp:Transcript_18980/g.28561  ORF Transcript_18980/g.28561 Transcript_18980/m.28561 type:complete len:112 (-) Transcript_18980:362-697(-)